MAYNAGQFQTVPLDGVKGIPVRYGAAPQQLLLPKYFIVKKWIIMSIFVCDIMVLAFCIFYVNNFVDYAMRHAPKHLLEPYEPETFRDGFLGTFIAAIMLNLIFLYGIARNSVCMATTLVVLMTFGAFSAVMQTVTNPAGWMNALVVVFVAFMAYSFMIDLRKVRDDRLRLGLSVI